jgi:hypothetical protein
LDDANEVLLSQQSLDLHLGQRISNLGPIHRKHCVSLASELQFTIVTVSDHKVLNTEKCLAVDKLSTGTGTRIMLANPNPSLVWPQI